MVSARIIAALSILFQCTRALVEFPKSKLFEEADFAVSELSIPIPEENNRIYVSIPESSAKIAQKLMVHGVYQDQISLYEISQMKMSSGEKGYFVVQKDVHQISIVNMNTCLSTAPIVLWIVWNQYPDYFPASVFDAANLTVPSSNQGFITVISAEPFTFHSKNTEQIHSYSAFAIMAGFDEYPQPNEEFHCAFLIYQMNNNADIWEIQAHVQSPLMTVYYNIAYKTEIWADVSKASTLDFSAISFLTSPGYMGCNNVNNPYQSFLNDATTSFKYYSEGSLFDVAITAFVNTDSAHPVIVNDTTNDNKFTFSGTNPEKGKNISMINTNNLEITWTRNEDDLDQSFLLRLTPTPS